MSSETLPATRRRGAVAAEKFGGGGGGAGGAAAGVGVIGEGAARRDEEVNKSNF